MSKSKHVDAVCVSVIVATLALTLLFLNVGPSILTASAQDPPYTSRLFDTSRIHTLNIVVNDKDWQDMLDNAVDKEYIPVHVVIDGEAIKNVAIRPKGASSLLTIAMSDSIPDRYSFKIEFDHYDSSKTYHGLDKLALNNLIQDNTYLMDYLAYDMMRYLGVKSPLASFVWVTVNKEDLGLYLAVEGIEEAFTKRSYGSVSGNLYKPDADNVLMGGDDILPGGDDDIQLGGSDVALVYSGEEPENYSNIFNHSALGEVSEADKRRLIRSLKQLNARENLSDVLDMDQVIRYFVAHNFVVNGDSYTGSLIHNYYLREQDGKLSMIPWDYNLSFGGMYMRFAQVGNEATSYVNAPIDTPVTGGDMEGRPMISWIFSKEEYRDAYHRVFDELLSGYFESGHFAREFGRMVELIAPFVQKEPTAFCTFEEFQAGTQTLKEFCDLRSQSVRKQLSGEIPATIEGQEADPQSLIDASALDLNDLTKNIEIGGPTEGNLPSGGSENEADGWTKEDIVMPLPNH